MRNVHRDEARWCAMLLKGIGQLEGIPSCQTGDFYEKCMAIGDLRARAAFINRGQGWVARKLREMLPKVRNDDLHADFAAMLRSHEENIACTNTLLGQTP